MEQIFDIRELDEFTIFQLQWVLNSPAFNDYFKKYMEQKRLQFIELGLNPDPTIRARYGGEEYLRCGANNIRDLLTFFDKIVAETNDEKVMAARSAVSEETIHLEALQQGIIGPQGMKQEPDFGLDEDL